MSDAMRALVVEHWRSANARDWSAFERLLHPDLRYDVPQTREYIESATGYLEMFRTWPGDWSARIRELVCEDAKAVCVIDFVVDGAAMTGISLFGLSDGRIVRVTDYWPDPYDPPPRETPHLKRRPA